MREVREMTGVETGRTRIRSASWHAQHARRGGRLPKGGGSGLTKGSKRKKRGARGEVRNDRGSGGAGQTVRVKVEACGSDQ